MALKFHRKICEQQLEEDGLTVMAAGIGVQSVFRRFLKVYCDKNKLVLVIHVPPQLQNDYYEYFCMTGVPCLPRIITNETSSSDYRTSIYLDGGVVFVTPWILILDLLLKRVPAHLITGIMVYDAHKVTEYSCEAFVLRIFRSQNKAFTDSAPSLINEFGALQRAMRLLYVKKLYLWPRFHRDVLHTLDKHKPTVIELRPKLSPSMVVLQQNIKTIMQACLDELKRCNQLDIGDVSLEDGLYKEFDLIVRNQLHASWHSVGPKTRQLVADLQLLRRLLMMLLRCDCVTFNRFLEAQKATLVAQRSMWLLVDAGANIFSLARARVFRSLGSKRQKVEHDVYGAKLATTKEESATEEDVDGPLCAHRQEDTQESQEPREQQQDAQNSAEEPDRGSPKKKQTIQEALDKLEQAKKKEEEMAPDEERFELVLEENPKWAALTQALSEVFAALARPEHARLYGAERVLVVVRDDRTRLQVERYLRLGGRAMLMGLWQQYLDTQPYVRRDTQQVHREASRVPDRTPRGRGRGRGRGGRKRAYNQPSRLFLGNSVTAREMYFHNRKNHRGQPREPLNDALEQQEVSTVELLKEHAGIVMEPLIVIHTPPGQQMLEDFAPKFVVLYDVELSFLRMLELYKATHAGTPLCIYFLAYDESAEEQKYIASLKRENEAFSQLIREKSMMIVPDDQDGKTEAEVEDTSIDTNTRIGGTVKVNPTTRPCIVVDVREFRSRLPCALHVQGFDIVPRTLPIGDYLLTPDICVERKSISDLFSSFSSGRLYTQAEAMCRSWSVPILLIEFDSTKNFILQERNQIGSDITAISISSKLALLTLHFPRLRLVWSRGAHATANIFASLKEGLPQPPQDGASTSTTPDISSVQPCDMLRRMPGVTDKNYHVLVDNVSSLRELSNLSMQRLQKLMGSRDGRKLFKFLRHHSDGNDA